MKTPIIVGLSGGVDSAVTALLLQQQGFDVTCVFMKNWEEDDTEEYCSAAADLKDAELICETLNLPLQTVNFASTYWDKVFEYFLQAYRAGHTPNPDILCNREIKFKAFLDYAKAQGVETIATGHYARLNHTDHGVDLLMGQDANKDQSYFLYALQQHQLKHACFPLGELTKPDVRKLAKKYTLPVYAKKDSTGICFIGERKFKDFLSTYLPTQPGEILSETGQCLGQHDGLMFYTIGQRQGLQLGGIKDFPEAPWYVAHKNMKDNTLTVVQGTDHPLLFKKTLHCNELTWTNTPPTFPLTCQAKIRYRQTASPCTVTYESYKSSDQLRVAFETPQRAVTKGQSIVFYDKAICLGGGIIV